MSVFGAILVRIFPHLDSVSLRIQSECGKMRTRITPDMVFFNAVNLTFYLSKMKLNTKDIVSVIRQKGESQNVCFKKTKQTEFSEKQRFLTPWYAHVLTLWYIKGRFALSPYYRRLIAFFEKNIECFQF